MLNRKGCLNAEYQPGLDLSYLASGVVLCSRVCLMTRLLKGSHTVVLRVILGRTRRRTD